jgi:periplasmic protein CpxP/Spy
MFLNKRSAMKKNWIIILVVFLLAANAALLATLLLSRHADRVTYRFHDKRFINDPEHRQGNFEMHIAEQLEMNEQQREQLRNCSMKFHDQKDTLESKILSINDKYFLALSDDATNTRLLETLADSIGILHTSMMKLDFEHYKDIKSICTPDQAVKFDSLGRVHMSKIKGENCLNERRRLRHSDK